MAADKVRAFGLVQELNLRGNVSFDSILGQGQADPHITARKACPLECMLRGENSPNIFLGSQPNCLISVDRPE